MFELKLNMNTSLSKKLKPDSLHCIINSVGNLISSVSWVVGCNESSLNLTFPFEMSLAAGNISYSDKPHLLVSMHIKQYLAIARPRENVYMHRWTLSSFIFHFSLLVLSHYVKMPLWWESVYIVLPNFLAWCFLLCISIAWIWITFLLAPP